MPDAVAADRSTTFPGAIYLIGPASRRPVKIGYSADPATRLRGIQTMSPTPLDVLWSHPGSRAVESALHRKFNALRLHGEWFDFGELDPVAEVCAEMSRLMAAAQAAEHRRAEQANLPATLVQVGKRMWVMRGDERFRCTCANRAGKRCGNLVYDFDQAIEPRRVWSLPGVGIVEGFFIPIPSAEEEDRVLNQLCKAHAGYLADTPDQELPERQIATIAEPDWELFDLRRHADLIVSGRYGQHDARPLPGFESLELRLQRHIVREARRLAFEWLPDDIGRALETFGISREIEDAGTVEL